MIQDRFDYKVEQDYGFSYSDIQEMAEQLATKLRPPRDDYSIEYVGSKGVDICEPLDEIPDFEYKEPLLII